MRAPLLAGLFSIVLLTAASNSKASAQSPSLTVSNSVANTAITDVSSGFQATPISLNTSVNSLGLISRSKDNVEAPTKQPDPKPEAKVHEVGDNDSLSSVAAKYDTTWIRLFNKNTQINDPNIITVGDKLIVPLADEQLTDRPLPEPPVAQVLPANYNNGQKPARANRPAAQPIQSAGPATSAGNTYAPGYCTWYAKNVRPDLPNNLGNANTWVARAAAQGIATGSTARAGAIGQQGMHVVYVQRVNDDGTIFVSEMNYAGLFVISTRTVSAGNFQYIY